MRLRTAIGLAGSFAVALGCSFGLDESLIPRAEDIPIVPRDPNAEGGLGGEGGGPVLPMGTKCATDAECQPGGNACLTGRCDTVRGVCVYDVCKQPAPGCAVAACNVADQTCGAPSGNVGYHSSVFDVGAAVPCADYQIGRCIAAAYPFVFVLTTTGVRAFSATDPRTTTPRSVAVTAPSFTPVQIVATANRLYMVGPSENVTSVRVAWIDLPVDPFVTSLTTSAPATVAMPNDAGASAVPGASDSVYVVGLVAPFQTAFVSATTTGNVPSFALPPLIDYATVPAASGARVFAANGFGGQDYRFVTNAGTASPTMTSDAGSAATSGMLSLIYAQGADGTVVALGGTFGGDLNSGFGTTDANVIWLVEDATSTTIGAKKVMIENYGLAQTFPLAGVAWLDEDRVLSAAEPVAGGGTTTTVKVVTKATDPPSMVPGKAFSIAPSTAVKVGVSASNGRGYALVADPSAKVHVFSPECP